MPTVNSCYGCRYAGNSLAESNTKPTTIKKLISSALSLLSTCAANAKKIARLCVRTPYPIPKPVAAYKHLI